MSKEIEMESFLDIYTKEIAPLLREIDLTIKTSEKFLSKSAVCGVLKISRRELNKIMEDNNIKQIDKPSFFVIMQNGTSGICGLYKREVESGSPYTYKADEIAYIYNLNLNDVTRACEKLGIIEVTPFTLPVLFSQIPAYDNYAIETAIYTKGHNG